MTVAVIMPTLNLNFSSRIKNLFAFIRLQRPRSTVLCYLPSVLPVYLVSLLQQKLPYLLHKAIVLSLSCPYHTDFWICGDSAAFYQYHSSCSERCFPGQHHILAVPVVQCNCWSVFSSALCESELGDIESSTVQQGTDDHCDLQSLSIFI